MKFSPKILILSRSQQLINASLNQLINQIVSNIFIHSTKISQSRSIRCRHCEHNVIKPEYNPTTSIKYRIQEFASSHVPKVRIIMCDKLEAGKSCLITLKMTNPTMNDMTITIMELPTEDEEKAMIEEMRKNFEKSVSVATKSTLMKPSLIEDPRMIECQTTAVLEPLDSSFVTSTRIFNPTRKIQSEFKIN
jgi:dynactin 4